jgi:hypothetical protein
VVLLVKKPTLIVFASGGIVAPLSETVVLQPLKADDKKRIYVISLPKLILQFYIR